MSLQVFAHMTWQGEGLTCQNPALVSHDIFMKQIERVSVFGLGKLGACIAATLAQRGFEVLGVDIDPEKVRKINEGQPPVEEPLLAETIAAGRTRLRATQDVGEAVPTDVSFFIHPSP